MANADHPSLQSHLPYWKKTQVLSMGISLGRVTSHISVYTDVFLTSWGGMYESQIVGGGTPAMVIQTPVLHWSGVQNRMADLMSHRGPSHTRSEVVGQVREGEAGSVRLTRERAMHTVVLHECTRRPSTGSGCLLSPAVVQSSPLRASNSSPDSSPLVLMRIQVENLAVVLVAPERTSGSWFPATVQLLAGKPRRSPWHRDALS